MIVARRVVVCAALCVIAACPKDDVARPLDRPAPPTHGLADARVLFVDGNVEITPPAGAPFAAKVGSDLIADDRIGAATSSKVVLVLRNGHAVRIDDAGALKVRDIVLFQAPHTDRPVDEQLKELLDVGESVPLDDVRDRAAAWRQMLRAAETGGAESSGDRMASSSEAAPAAAAVASADSAPKAEEAAAKGGNTDNYADQNAPSKVAGPSAPPPAGLGKEALSGANIDEGLGGLGLRGTGPGGGGMGEGAGIGSIGGLGRGAGSGYGAKEGAEGKRGKRKTPKNDVAAPEAAPEADAKKAENAETAEKAAPPPQLSKEQPGAVVNEPSRQRPTNSGALGSAVPSGFVARFGASVAEAQAIDLTPALATLSTTLGKCIGASLPASVSLSTIELLVEVRDGKTKRVRMSGALPVPLCARNVAVENSATEIASTRGTSGWLVVTVPLSR